jgi:hypothetical protein
MFLHPELERERLLLGNEGGRFDESWFGCIGP